MDFSNASIEAIAVKVAEHLQSHGIDVVLVGGLAVEIYTENLYLTKDIDMVNTNYASPPALRKAMEALGFHKKGRVFLHPSTDISVEFPPAPLSIGDELVTDTAVAYTEGGRIPILRVEDVAKDRMAAYIHWHDRQSLIQALAILMKHPVDLDALERFCAREGASEAFSSLKILIEKAKEQELSTMIELESLVVDYMISV